MKYLHHILVTIALAILALGCANETPSTNHVISIAVDLSEVDSFRPKVDAVLERLESDNIFDGIELSYIPIKDTRYTERLTFVLSQSASDWSSNEDTRRTLRRQLFQRFGDTLAKYSAGTTPLRYSIIFGTVVSELNELATRQGKRKLIVVSDLKEHNSIFSIYDPKQARQLLKHPDKVRERFEAVAPLADELSGVHLEIIHSPNPEDEQLFSAMVALYRSCIESRGGTLSIGNQKTVKL